MKDWKTKKRGMPRMRQEPYEGPPEHYQDSPRRRLLWAMTSVLERLANRKGEDHLVVNADRTPLDAPPLSIRSIEHLRETAEKKAERIVREHFQAEERAILNAVRGRSSLQPDSLDAVVEAQSGEWLRVLERIYQETGQMAGSRTWAGFHRKGLVLRAISFTEAEAPWMQPVARFLRLFGASRVQDITETSRKKLRRVLADSIESGEPISGTVDRITDMFKTMSTGRATVIARNETLNASSLASHAAAHASGVTMDKLWRTAKDSRVRDDHRKADGQRRPLTQPYIVGGERMMYPGDPSMGASPENVIQCRCVELYVPARRGRR